MSEITSHGPTASEDLATLLLGDDLTVRKLRLECKDDNDAFVRKMFDAWLNQDDSTLLVPLLLAPGRSCANVLRTLLTYQGT